MDTNNAPASTTMTLDTVRRLVLEMVDGSPLAQQLTDRDRLRLQEGNELGQAGCLYLTFRDERAGVRAEATMRVKVEHVDDTSREMPNGDLRCRFSCEVGGSWPAWGMDSVGATSLRAGIIHEMSRLAEALQRRLAACPIEDVWMTAAEVQAQAGANEARKNQALAAAVLDELNPRMRVGDARTVDGARVRAPYPSAGAYTVARGKRTYTMNFALYGDGSVGLVVARTE